MDYRQIAKVSFESLGAHKLRTTLTMLGVIFGVAAVIAMLSIGEGAKEEALEQISILGINNIIVNAKMLDETAEAKSGSQRSLGLSIADGENIARFPELVANVVPAAVRSCREYQRERQPEPGPRGRHHTRVCRVVLNRG
jgi:putative ABC transport system permease protein